MKRILVMTTFLLSFSLFSSAFSTAIAAETVKTTINQIYEPTTDDPEYLILANNGHVYGIHAEDEELARIAREALAGSSVIELELEPRDNLDESVRDTVEDIAIIDPVDSVHIPLRPEDEPGFNSFDVPTGHITPMDGFRVTTLSNSGNRSLFSSMRNDLSGASECYNRAHVWSWEIYQKNRYNTGKMFLFFTRRYINEYRYKWWFHVAPFIAESGRPQYMVLDRQYTRSPLQMHTWTDVFMRNDAHCPVVDRYSSYSQNQYSRYCYLIPASMYYWQPYNLDRLERYHTTKRVFIRGEINHSYRDARRGYGTDVSETTVERD